MATLKEIREELKKCIKTDMNTELVDEIMKVDASLEKYDTEQQEKENEHLKLKEKYIDLVKNYPAGEKAEDKTPKVVTFENFLDEHKADLEVK